MSAVTFDTVAVATKELQVIKMIRSADRCSNNVVNFKESRLEMLFTPVTIAFLLAV